MRVWLCVCQRYNTYLPVFFSYLLLFPLLLPVYFQGDKLIKRVEMLPTRFALFRTILYSSLFRVVFFLIFSFFTVIPSCCQLVCLHASTEVKPSYTYLHALIYFSHIHPYIDLSPCSYIIFILCSPWASFLHTLTSMLYPFMLGPHYFSAELQASCNCRI